MSAVANRSPGSPPTYIAVHLPWATHSLLPPLEPLAPHLFSLTASHTGTERASDGHPAGTRRGLLLILWVIINHPVLADLLATYSPRLPSQPSDNESAPKTSPNLPVSHSEPLSFSWLLTCGLLVVYLLILSKCSIRRLPQASLFFHQCVSEPPVSFSTTE